VLGPDPKPSRPPDRSPPRLYADLAEWWPLLSRPADYAEEADIYAGLLEAAGDRELDELVSRLSTLTPQQVRVLIMLSEGLLNKQIAYNLSVSEATIKAHVSAILQKLGVDSRTQAVIVANKINPLEWQKDLH